MNKLRSTVMLIAIVAAGSHAQQFPTRPIRLIVGSSAGGGGDGVARVMAAILNETLNVVLRDDDTQRRFKAMGNEIASSTPDQFDALIRAEIPKWAEVARRAGIKPE